jgi:hypothetical protein
MALPTLMISRATRGRRRRGENKRRLAGRSRYIAGMEDITWPGVAMLAVLFAGQALVVWIASRR